jgi:exodeoxyribonuclease-5
MLLTQEQEAAVTAACNTDKEIFKIGGYAGTGKTTILKEIMSRHLNMGACAYTGKAASVLRSKGIKDATTIHKKIYQWVDDRFYKVKSLNYNRLGIDEGSMVGSDIFADLCSYKVPLVILGDPGQLEPIGSKEINLMREPDITLNQIHRQAENNPIIKLATAIRLRNEYETEKLDKDYYDWADIVICGYNKTRVEVNKHVRRNRKELLEVGERIICLRNNTNLRVFNGLIMEVTAIKERNTKYWRIDALADDGTRYSGLPVWTGNFNRASTVKYSRKGNNVMIADYGYAITCHKSQGSEWDKVLVINQSAPKLWDQQRWLYTAVTRASKELKLTC